MPEAGNGRDEEAAGLPTEFGTSAESKRRKKANSASKKQETARADAAKCFVESGVF